MAVLRLRRCGDGLFVCDVGLLGRHLDVESTLQPAEHNVQMQAAHARGDQFACYGIALYDERWVFTCNLRDAAAELLLIAPGFRLNGQGHHRGGELYLGEPDLPRVGAEGIAHLDVVELRHAEHVAGSGRLHGLLLLALHAVEIGKAFLLAGAWIIGRRVARDRTRDNTEEVHFSDERIRHRLEDQRGEFRVGRLDGNLFSLFTFHRRGGPLGRLRRGEEARKSVEDVNDAYVLRNGGAEDRHNCPGLERGAEGLEKFFLADLFAVEVAHHQFFVRLDDGLHQRLVGRLRLVCRLRGDVGRKPERFHHAAEIGRLADRQHKRHALLAEDLLDLAERL